MAYPYVATVNMGSAGLTVTATVLNSAGVALGVQPSGTVTDVGGGNYLYFTAVMPDGTVGAVKLSDGTNSLVAPIAPREHENADVHSSTISLIGSGTGTGNIPVNENMGGTDNLRYVSGGSGVDQAAVTAYLATDYDSSVFVPKGQTYTKSDGRWVTPLMLDAGQYVFVFNLDGQFGPDVKRATVA